MILWSFLVNRQIRSIFIFMKTNVLNALCPPISSTLCAHLLGYSLCWHITVFPRELSPSLLHARPSLCFENRDLCYYKSKTPRGSFNYAMFGISGTDLMKLWKMTYLQKCHFNWNHFYSCHLLLLQQRQGWETGAPGVQIISPPALAYNAKGTCLVLVPRCVSALRQHHSQWDLSGSNMMGC